jgi:hypothetical protein
MIQIKCFQNCWWLKQVIHIIPAVPQRIRHTWVDICIVLLCQWFPKNWHFSEEYLLASKFVLLTKCYLSHQKNRWNEQGMQHAWQKLKIQTFYSGDYKGTGHFTDLGEGERTELKWMLNNRMLRHGLKSAGSGKVPMAAICEYNHEPLGSIQVRISRQTMVHGVGCIPQTQHKSKYSSVHYVQPCAHTHLSSVNFERSIWNSSIIIIAYHQYLSSQMDYKICTKPH